MFQTHTIFPALSQLNASGSHPYQGECIPEGALMAILAISPFQKSEPYVEMLTNGSVP
jgi:hypothetical protein